MADYALDSNSNIDMIQQRGDWDCIQLAVWTRLPQKKHRVGDI